MTLRKRSEFKTQTVSMYGEGDGEERQIIRLEIIKKMFKFGSGVSFFISC